ncbi:hypothetical protein AHF37_03394 [Paragonimus kellicotti]|nr:hypothetical protein AHF37_03394 [Paragonimus kellicotti]
MLYRFWAYIVLRLSYKTFRQDYKTADVPKTTGSLSTLRERFESRGQAATSPSGLTAAQQRVAEERALWEVERNKTAAMESSKPLQEQQRPVPQVSANGLGNTRSIFYAILSQSYLVA